jgi:hypothetical protein
LSSAFDFQTAIINPGKQPVPLKTDESISGIVKDITDPKVPTGTDLMYQSSSQQSRNPSNTHDDLSRCDRRDTGTSMASSRHYNPKEASVATRGASAITFARKTAQTG